MARKDGTAVGASDAARCERALDVLAAALEARGERGWIVGGCLRDALLGRPVRDVDVALTGDPLTFARSLPLGVVAYLAPLSRDTVRIGLRVDADDNPLQVDLSPLHSSAGNGQAPDSTIEADLSRRDFRVNAMALPLAARRELVALLAVAGAHPVRDGTLPAPDHLIDPLDGYADLQRRLLDAASAHALTDDPGRIIRAARLAASLGFTPAASLIRQAQGNARRLIVVPGDRLREEMSLLLALPRAAAGAGMLAELGALSVLLPGLAAPALAAHALATLRAVECLQESGVPNATPSAAMMAPLAALEPLRAWYAAPLRLALPRIAALRWALLIHAAAPHAGNPDAERAALIPQALADVTRVPLGGGEQRIGVAVWTCVTWWRERLAETMPTDATLRRFFAAQSGAAVDVLIAAAACNAALAEAPLPGARVAPGVPERVRAILAVYFTDRKRLDPPPPVTGADLIAALNLPAGPALGALLRAIREAQLDGAITTREEALALARRLAAATPFPVGEGVGGEV